MDADADVSRMIEESPSENPKGEKSKKGELSMLGKFYNINSQTLASGDIMTLATSRTCGCGIKLEGNEIVISTPGSYLIGVSVTAAQTSTTAQGVRLLVSTQESQSSRKEEALPHPTQQQETSGHLLLRIL